MRPQFLVNKFQTGQSFEAYPNVAHLVSEVMNFKKVENIKCPQHKAADFINVTGKKVLVIGSQAPWVEAILLTKNPEKIVTVEYGHFQR